jgi:hypothetical protein
MKCGTKAGHTQGYPLLEDEEFTVPRLAARPANDMVLIIERHRVAACCQEI